MNASRASRTRFAWSRLRCGEALSCGKPCLLQKIHTLAAVAVPVAAFSAYRLTRSRNYTQTREFQALAGGYLI